jgi:NAD(P)-dependent dehydrogenase (short-subunit alcohol dehydrogenase family)
VDGSGRRRLAGARALITGASSGIGEATARAFVREGVAAVGLVARRRAALETAADGFGDIAFALPCDVSDDAAVATMVGEAWERMGGIDVLVHSAGVSNLAVLDELTPERWRAVIDIDLSGAFYVCREVGLRMRSAELGGSIVTVASDSALLGEAAFVAYCAAKGGMVAMTRALAAELLPNVRVNAVLPGAIDTPMVRRDLAELDDPQGAFREIEARIPMGRLGRADEVADAIVFLAAEGTYATGSALSLDGGTTSIIAPFAD